jgi:hypothetical protein
MDFRRLMAYKSLLRCIRLHYYAMGWYLTMAGLRLAIYSVLVIFLGSYLGSFTLRLISLCWYQQYDNYGIVIYVYSPSLYRRDNT